MTAEPRHGRPSQVDQHGVDQHGVDQRQAGRGQAVQPVAPPHDARSRLADRQAALVRALLADGPVPEGFDSRRVRVEATALRNKRRRLAEQLRPDLADALDDRFPELFDRWARAHPRRSGVSFRDDLRGFADWLATENHLPG